MSYDQKREKVLDKLVSNKNPRYNRYVHNFGLDLMQIIDTLEERVKQLENQYADNKS